MSGAPARVFVGLPLPTELAQPLAAATAACLPVDAFRLTPAADLHLTLAFLGDVVRTRLDGLAQQLNAACATCAAPTLELGTPGAFPEVRAARVLWVGVREGEPGRLAALHAAVGAASARAGLAPAQERFHPHVTVARPRRAGTPVPPDFLALVPRGSFVPAATVLFESRPASGPGRYLPLARAGFREIS